MESDKLRERGRLEGRMEIVCHALRTMKESYSSDEVAEQLKRLFGLTDEETAEYMKME